MWWEKTVEYKFVLDMTRDRELSFAAPLSGVEERAGDSVFAHDDKVVLVEFKRSIADLKSESKKFTQKTAVDQLCEQDGHHFFIYGSVEDEIPTLKLHVTTYFSRRDVPEPLNLLMHGVKTDEFNNYLKQFLRLKKRDARTTEGSSSRSVKTVIGVSPNGACSISLSEYVRIAIPELYRMLEVELGESLSI